MKRLALITIMLGLATAAWAETISWTLPTQYTDNTAISPADQAQIVTNLYVNGTKFASSAPGATSWTGTLPLARGVPGTYTATAVLHGVESAPSPGVTYTVPFIPTKSPGALSITP